MLFLGRNSIELPIMSREAINNVSIILTLIKSQSHFNNLITRLSQNWKFKRDFNIIKFLGLNIK